MGCLLCLPLNRSPNDFQADFCFRNVGLCCGPSIGFSHVLVCLGSVSRCVVAKTGSVTARFQVGGVVLDELLGPSENADALLSGMVGRWATDVGGVLFGLVFTKAGDGHLKLWLLV